MKRLLSFCTILFVLSLALFACSSVASAPVTSVNPTTLNGQDITVLSYQISSDNSAITIVFKNESGQKLETTVQHFLYVEVKSKGTWKDSWHEAVLQTWDSNPMPIEFDPQPGTIPSSASGNFPHWLGQANILSAPNGYSDWIEEGMSLILVEQYTPTWHDQAALDLYSSFQQRRDLKAEMLGMVKDDVSSPYGDYPSPDVACSWMRYRFHDWGFDSTHLDTLSAACPDMDEVTVQEYFEMSSMDGAYWHDDVYDYSLLSVAAQSLSYFDGTAGIGGPCYVVGSQAITKLGINVVPSTTNKPFIYGDFHPTIGWFHVNFNIPTSMGTNSLYSPSGGRLVLIKTLVENDSVVSSDIVGCYDLS